MQEKKSLFALYVLTAAALVGAPLIGVLVTDQPIGRYLEFPPLTRYVRHEPFNGTVFAIGTVFCILVILLVGFILSKSLLHWGDREQRKFPWWGWLGVLVVVSSWILAWNRFPWFTGLQPYTFTPLWLGYILSVNGVTRQRSGTCLITRCPGRFSMLFPVSALFWWYFEWLNRFVQNWYYLGIDGFTALGYVLHATICFSTVLPAVVSTTELLGTVFRFPGSSEAGEKKGRRKTLSLWSVPLWLLAGISCGGLVIWPDYLFPLVWVSPIPAITALQIASGRETLIDRVKDGDWQFILLPALAALVCGFFWEMWNWKSFARWEYSISYVDRYHLFAMPILGYLGYLPFGLECQVLAVGFMKDIAGHEQG